MEYQDLIGKPYKENGRGPDGYDCYGICIEVCKRIGIYLPELKDILEKRFIRINKPRAGDIAIIETTYEMHVGVMINASQLLQVNSLGRRGVHRIRIDHPWLKQRISGFYRYAEQ